MVMDLAVSHDKNPKSEYRNSKRTYSQINLKNGKSKTLNSNPPVWSIAVVLFFIILDLFRVSNFVLRIFVLGMLCPSLILSRFIVIIILLVGEKIRLIAGNLVTLFGPRAKIDQAAPLRAKRPVRIIFPGNFFAACRALHRERHRYPRYDYYLTFEAFNKKSSRIYRAKTPTKQIRNPNIESGPADRNKLGQNKSQIRKIQNTGSE
jgi:hypothetical protein